MNEIIERRDPCCWFHLYTDEKFICSDKVLDHGINCQSDCECYKNNEMIVVNDDVYKDT